jgi:hypothetical protein
VVKRKIGAEKEALSKKISQVEKGAQRGKAATEYPSGAAVQSPFR